MNTNWTKILLFSLLALALGFIIGMMCRSHCYGSGHCGKDGYHQTAGCGSGSSCCKGDDHYGGSSCHRGGKRDHHDKGHGDGEAHEAIERIKASDFQGDTTVAIEGGTVKIHREGDEMKVEVEMKRSHKGHEKVEKTVTVE